MHLQLLADPDLKKSLRYIVTSRGVDEEDADDVVAETMLAACSSKRLPDDPEERATYIRVMARNIAIDHATEKEEHPEDSYDDEDLAIPGVEPAPMEDRDALSRLAATVEPSDLHVLGWLVRHVLGETYEEIAEKTDLSADTMRKRVSRLRDELHDRAMKILTAIAILILAASLFLAGNRRHPSREIATKHTDVDRREAPLPPAETATPEPPPIVPAASAPVAPRPSPRPEQSSPPWTRAGDK
jgi:RNA polymerase sigma factor (sigma-70 family)